MNQAESWDTFLGQSKSDDHTTKEILFWILKRSTFLGSVVFQLRSNYLYYLLRLPKYKEF